MYGKILCSLNVIKLVTTETKNILFVLQVRFREQNERGSNQLRKILPASDGFSGLCLRVLVEMAIPQHLRQN